MTAAAEGEAWPQLLEACVAGCRHFHTVTVLRETESTQDAAVRLGAAPGDIVTTLRQTAGRGRLGRRWADTGTEGVALTLVVEAAPPERLAMLAAVAVARAAARCIGSRANQLAVGVRWPNDIMVAGRKLAGILVEQDKLAARVGIGLNVAQQAFPPEIADRACSLAQLGAAVERSAVIAAIIACLDAALAETNASLARDYADRDVLRGAAASFIHDRRTIAGKVLEVDPLRGLRVLTSAGEVFLPAQTTSLVSTE